MTASLFTSFPDAARLWIYAADRPLAEPERQALLDSLDGFLASWTSHGRVVRGEAQIVDDRFLLVAATLVDGDISGCGIDASVHAIEAAAEAAGVRWLSPLLVFYRSAAGGIEAVPRGVFRKAVRSGAVTAETPVFDVSLTTVGDLRGLGLERPAGAAWHAKAFRIPQAA